MQMMPNLVKKQFGIWEERRREKNEKQKNTENAVNKTMQCAQRAEQGGGGKTPNSKHSLNSNESENENGIYVTRRRFMAREIFQNIQQVELSWVKLRRLTLFHTHTQQQGEGKGRGGGRLLPLLGRLLHFNFDLHSGPKESSKWAY